MALTNYHSTNCNIRYRSHLLLARCCGCSWLDRLCRRVCITEIGELFPWCRQIELSEFLCQFEGFADDTFLLVVVTQLNVARQGEVTTLWVTLESVIGQNAAQVGVVGEEDTVHVPDFTFIPIGRLVHFAGGIQWSKFICVGLDTNARVVAQRQQIVDNLEAVLAARYIHASYVHQVGELCLMMILQELQHGHNSFGRNQHLQLIT